MFGDYVVFEVEDDGCGMSVEMIICIFDFFFMIKFIGCGFGFVVVFGIVCVYCGVFFVCSIFGKGMIFIFVFFLVEGVVIVLVKLLMFVFMYIDKVEGMILIVDDEF